MTEPERIARTARLRDELRRGPAGNGGGRDDDVELGEALLERRLLLRLLLGGQLGRVAALGLLAADAEVEERRAERLHLLLHDGAHVEPGDDGAEAAGGGERLEPGDARAEHEHLRGRNRPGRGRQHREELRQPLGGEQHGLVAADGRLGREGVHGLRARDARDRLHRERDDALRAEPLDALGVGERLEERDEDVTAPELPDLLGGRLLHHDDRLGLAEDGVGYGRPGRLVLAVGEARRRPRSSLDGDVKPAPTRREAMSGTRATRRSPGAVSFGTPTSMRRNSTRAAGISSAEGNGADAWNHGRMALMDLARAIEARDPYSSGHAARVTAIAEVVAARLGWDEDQIDVLRIGAALHDIGKGEVPDTVLRKPGPLDEDEFDHVRAHPEEGSADGGARAGRGGQPCRASSITTSAGTAAGTRPAAPARTSRPRRACSPSPTRSTR